MQNIKRHLLNLCTIFFCLRFDMKINELTMLRFAILVKIFRTERLDSKSISIFVCIVRNKMQACAAYTRITSVWFTLR